ncbi:hypothetical protein [Lentzea flava]|uniref:X-X-X-Leu-X-X-Gly heptad repeat-containing protein n=1 Tax=Lentzea flava TaxID=103732 RepID=A0ABQ2VBQ4_9PSEU|nr:hypothetical protein [Lentzea flava]MCP2204378.1 hypothetical protein [Lentzea flava]GGU77140.1 hypothetical protein GCM10010178_80470 [Lentzea flava]
MLISLGAVLLALVLLGVWPTTSGQFRSTVESSVQDAVSSVGTARTTGQTALRGNTFGAYESTVLDDTRKSVATAITDVVESEVPDQDSRRLRDEVLPLLQESARLIGDLGTGLDSDDRGLASSATDGLAEVGERLTAALEGLR